MWSIACIAAMKQTTRTIPIVFSVVNDPLGQGFIANQARPGGNITGFTFVDFPMIGKWLELLKEIAPGVNRITLLFNPQTAAYYPIFLRAFAAGAAALAAEISSTPVRDTTEIEAAAGALARERAASCGDSGNARAESPALRGWALRPGVYVRLRYRRSMMVAVPMPPPQHMVSNP